MNYVERLEEDVSGSNGDLSEKEFKEALNRVTGDKVKNYSYTLKSVHLCSYTKWKRVKLTIPL